MRVKVIINPAAGQDEPVLRILNDVFAAEGVEWDVDVTHGSGDGFRGAQSAVDDGFDVVCAYGGDGTVTEVAAALCGGRTPMAVLPGGTGNAFAEDLGIPGDLEGAAKLLASGQYALRDVDMGKVGNRLFALRLTMGFEASVVEAASREMKDRFGWLAYAFAGLQTLADPPRADYRVEVDGEVHEVSGVACIVANSASTGVAGLRLSPQVSVSDGLLDVIVAETVDLRQLAATLAGGPVGEQKAEGSQPAGPSRWQGAKIRIEAEPDQTALADGEEAGRTPVEVSVVPKALRVVVPDSAPAS